MHACRGGSVEHARLNQPDELAVEDVDAESVRFLPDALVHLVERRALEVDEVHADLGATTPRK